MTLAPGIELPVGKIAEICRKYQVRELAVFGSAARGEMRPDSDIDLLVEFEPDARIGLFKFAAMEGELSALIGRKVDLVTKLGLKPWIRPHVMQDAKVLYAA
jgi:predicted nucleotidyltransferase